MSEDLHRRALHAARTRDLDTVHELVQHESDKLSALLHAWMHRAEGDTANARYWYARADEPVPNASLDDELNEIAARVGAH